MFLELRRVDAECRERRGGVCREGAGSHRLAREPLVTHELPEGDDYEAVRGRVCAERFEHGASELMVGHVVHKPKAHGEVAYWHVVDKAVPREGVLQDVHLSIADIRLGERLR